MKTPLFWTNAILLAAGIMAVTTGAPSWTHFGLKDESVNTILTLSPGNGEDALMVGTSKGIWNHEYGRWVSVWQGLPVYDMRLIAYNKILAAAGNGSDSDGIYLGEVVAIGEPGNLWRFRLLVKYPRPTVMEYRDTGVTGGRCEGTLYVGGDSGVSRGAVCSGSVEAFVTVATPANPWGRCASLLLDSATGTLWAGGNYGFVATMASTTASLLRGTGALTELKKLNVTSMVEYSSQGDTLVAATTVDSGIQIFRKGVQQSILPAPGREPVVSIVPLATSQDIGSGKWTMLVIGTPKGIYRQSPPETEMFRWIKLGDELPAAVRCLAQYEQRVVWAGTDSGIYRYEYTTANLPKTESTMMHRSYFKTIRSDNTTTVFRFTGKDASGYSLRVFDLCGRCIGKCVAVGNSIFIPAIGSGTFVWRAYCGDGPVAAGKFVCQ